MLGATFQASTTGNSSDHSYNKYTKTQLSILAMSTINEIIYRHCVPADFEDFLLQMFQVMWKFELRFPLKLISSKCKDEPCSCLHNICTDILLLKN